MFLGIMNGDNAIGSVQEDHINTVKVMNYELVDHCCSLKSRRSVRVGNAYSPYSI